MGKYLRGSEWRKWDLQIHTPHSALNNGFGSDFEHYAKTLFERAIENNIATIGVTDYFSIEGYKQLTAIVRDEKILEEVVGSDLAPKCKNILLLPNIELRTSVIITDPKGDDSRVNFHVLFSEEVSIEDIQENFLQQLQFTAESGPDTPDERLSLTLSNLASLGSRLKEEHVKFSEYSDIFVGMMNAVVNHEQVTQVLRDQSSRFGNKYLIVVPVDEDLSKCSWDGQGHLTRKLLIQKSSFLFSGNPNTREFGLGLKHTTVQDFEKEFKGLKPCIHSSDSHDYDSLFEPDLKRYTWIKADPTFRGLRQVIREPMGRVYIGEQPPILERVEKHKTKYINSIDIRKNDSTFTDVWFDQDIVFNHNLVAIIGNKGSGKSALADILGLIGNTKQNKSFEFLKENKFRDVKNNLSKYYDATMKWESGDTVRRNLSEEVDDEEVETVKYIPQNHLENICNEIEAGDDSEFQKELQTVIFSRVKYEDKLGFHSLKELLDFKTEESSQAIKQIYSLVDKANEEAIRLEVLSNPKHKKMLENKLKEKNRELEAHDKTRPPKVQKPEEDIKTNEQVKTITGQIENNVEVWDKYEKEIEKAEQELSEKVKILAIIDKLESQIGNLETYINDFKAEAKLLTDDLGLNLEDIVSYKINRKKITALREQNEKQKSDVLKNLDEDNEDGLVRKFQAIVKVVTNLRQQLDKPNKEYQAYLKAKAEWEKQRKDTMGTGDSVDSIEGLKWQINELKNVPEKLQNARKRQIEESLKIIKEKQNLTKVYAELYGPVQKFISEHPLAQDKFNLEFSVAISESGFVDKFLSYVNQGRKGSFQGKDEGEKAVKRLVDTFDLQTEAGVKSFLETTVEHLKTDKRKEPFEIVMVEDQINKGFSTFELYQYMFNLEYLEPKYVLMWEGKHLDQLSPGERGTLLLIFYLLVDDSVIPLIIDQPEGNLDNHTVAQVLVECVREAKMRRQVFLVTHNPNLAVVCDAEQIIYSKLEKDNRNTLTYETGALEEPNICELVVGVLEGSRPVFDIREYKYSVGE